MSNYLSIKYIITILIIFSNVIGFPIFAGTLDYDFEFEGLPYRILSEEEKTAELGKVPYTYRYEDPHFDIPGFIENEINGEIYKVIKIGQNAFYELQGDRENGYPHFSVSLPETIEVIGNSAFDRCNVSIGKLPDSVKIIEDYAFLMGSAPELGNSIEYIGVNAFAGTAMGYPTGELILPESLKHIGNYAFGGCWNITSVIIPKNVEYIAGNAFGNCDDLTVFEISPENPFLCVDEGIVYNSDKSAVFLCLPWVTSVILPETVVSIGDYAFSHSALEGSNPSVLEKVYLPESIKEIGAYAFQHCTRLSKITLPSDLKVINKGVFYGCENMSQLTFPSSLERIEDSAFGECRALTTIVLPSVQYIGKRVFIWCSGLSSLQLPANLEYLGDEALFDCEGLRSLICEALTPSVCGDNVFKEVPTAGWGERCKLYVPEESLELYATTAPWNEFQLIYTIQETGVDLTLQEQTGIFKVYDLQGKHVIETSNPSDIENLPRDIYIINGKKSLVGK